MPLDEEAADFETAFEEFSGAPRPGEETPPAEEPETPAVEETEEEAPTDDEAPAESETEEVSQSTEESAQDLMAAITRERDEYRHRYLSDQGRVSALQRKINELEQQSSRKPAEQKPVELPAAAKELMENYPEIAEGVRAMVEAERSRIMASVEGQVDPLRRATAEQLERDARNRTRELEAAVEAAHTGWVDTVQTPDFQGWLARQSSGVRGLAGSAEPEDAITLLNLYKGVSLQAKVDLNKPDTSRADTLAAKRRKALDDAEAIPSSAVSKRESVPDDFEAQFNYFASK